MTSITRPELTVTHCDVPFVVKGVNVSPAVPANEIDPPEPVSVEWDRVEIGCVDVSALCHGELGQQLEDAVIAAMESEL